MAPRHSEQLSAREAQREMREARLTEPFARGGRNRLMKVLEVGAGAPSLVSGYVTQEAFLVGLTPKEIEARLGLPVDRFRDGCQVVALARQPGPSEVVYELTTAYPDGLAFTAASDPRFPPSDVAFVHQWRLTKAIPAMFVTTVGPGERYFSRGPRS